MAYVKQEKAEAKGSLEESLKRLCKEHNIQLSEGLREDILHWGLGLKVKATAATEPGPYIEKKKPIFDQKEAKKETKLEEDKTGEFRSQLKVPKQSSDDCAADPLSGHTITDDQDPTAW